MLTLIASSRKIWSEHTRWRFVAPSSKINLFSCWNLFDFIHRCSHTSLLTFEKNSRKSSLIVLQFLIWDDQVSNLDEVVWKISKHDIFSMIQTEMIKFLKASESLYHEFYSKEKFESWQAKFSIVWSKHFDCKFLDKNLKLCECRST